MGIHYSLMHFDLIQVPKIWCRMTWGWCLLILIKAKGTRLFFSTQPQFSCTDRVREKHNGWTLSDCQHHHLRHAVTKPLLQNDDVCIKLQEVTSSKRSPWTWPYAGLVSSTDGQAGKLGGGRRLRDQWRPVPISALKSSSSSYAIHTKRCSDLIALNYKKTM